MAAGYRAGAEGSFIGSDPKDRDIYIEQVYDVDDQGNWTIRTLGKGIYIAGAKPAPSSLSPAVQESLRDHKPR